MNTFHISRPFQSLVFVSLSFVIATPGFSQEDHDALKHSETLRTKVWFHSIPEYEVGESVEVPAEVPAELWIQALKRGERNLICEAAEAFGKAKDLNSRGIPENIGQILLEVFEQTDDEVARESLALALVKFDNKPALPVLAKFVNQGNYRFDRIVEPALARWQNRDVIQRNRQRIEDQSTPMLWMTHAIDVLGETSIDESREALMKLVLEERIRPDLRVLAAKSMTRTTELGFTSDAKELVSRDPATDPIASLLAVKLLERQRDQDTVEILKELIGKFGPTVQANAIAILQQIDDQVVIEVADDANFGVEHPHSGLRQVIIESSRAVGGLAAIDRMVPFLDDPHPTNRELVADALYDLASQNEEFRMVVRDYVYGGLENDSWRVLEKASLLAAGLEMKETAPRMGELLSHPRTEVGKTAAYALKMFASEEMLPIALEQLNANLDLIFELAQVRSRREYLDVTEQCQHLCEYFGNMKYQKAEPTLLRLLPKQEPRGEVIADPLTRGVAMATLGRLYENNPEEQLVRKLLARLNDIHSLEPEEGRVREGCAYALGWMQATQAVPSLRLYQGRNTEMRTEATACAWAVQHLTGETLPVGKRNIFQRQHKWFLMPTKEILQ